MNNAIYSLCALLALLLLPTAAEANFAVVTGNCIVVNQSIQLKQNSALNQELNCETPDPKDAFRVRYVWLDANSVSFLLGDVLSNDLKKLLGDDPIIARNSVYEELNSIWSQFSTKVSFADGYAFSSRGSFFIQSVAHIKGLTDSEVFQLGDISPEQLANVKFYDASDEVVWPHTRQLEETLYSPKLTPGMNITYGFGGDGESNRYAINSLRKNRNSHREFSNGVFNCALSYDFVTKRNFEQYWDDAEYLRQKLIRSEEFKEYVSFVEPSLEYTTQTPISSAALDSFGYFGRHNWPRDFLVRYYKHTFGGCDHEPSLRAIPRQIFVKFAVVQSKSGKFDLEGYVFKESNFTGLRKIGDSTMGQTKFFRTGELGRAKDQSLLIPMVIELRYPLDEYPFSAILENPAAQSFYREIQRSRFNEFSYYRFRADGDAYESPIFTKNKRAFGPPVNSNITRTYVYGPQVEIEAIKVGGSNIGVRRAPAVASLLNGGFEEGSCPFLYFQLATGELVKHGRILIGAHGEENEMVEKVHIPRNAVAVIIREEEPEISFLRDVSISKDGGSSNVSIAQMVRLDPQKELVIPLIELYNASLAKEYNPRYLTVTGFYRQLK